MSDIPSTSATAAGLPASTTPTNTPPRPPSNSPTSPRVFPSTPPNFTARLPLKPTTPSRASRTHIPPICDFHSTSELLSQAAATELNNYRSSIIAREDELRRDQDRYFAAKDELVALGYDPHTPIVMVKVPPRVRMVYYRLRLLRGNIRETEDVIRWCEGAWREVVWEDERRLVREKEEWGRKSEREKEGCTCWGGSGAGEEEKRAVGSRGDSALGVDQEGDSEDNELEDVE